MGVDNLRRWHWAIIGILVGLAVAAVHSMFEPDMDKSFVRTFNSQREFETFLTLPAKGPDGGWIPNKFSDVVIHPAKKDRPAWLSFMWVRPTREPYDPGKPEGQRKGYLSPAALAAVKEPYIPAVVQPAAPKPNLTIQEYLADVQKNFPDAKISYRLAWWEIDKYVYPIYAGVGLVVIGGIWPSIIGLMTGGGIWGPKRKEDEYDLSRYGKGGSQAQAGGAVVSDEEKAKLAEMEDALLAKLDGFGAPNRDQDSIDEDAETVKPLTGGPLKGGRAVAEAEESKEYKGDFYPVARPHGHGKKDGE